MFHNLIKLPYSSSSVRFYPSSSVRPEFFYSYKKVSKGIFLIFLFFTLSLCATDPIQLTVSSNKQTAMPIAIITNTTSAAMHNIATTIKKDLLFTDQFSPTIHHMAVDAPKTALADTIKKISLTTPFALYLNTQADNSITWRLYDTFQGKKLAGKKYSQKNTLLRATAHRIADEIVSCLTGNDGFFSSRIVYCKELKNDANKIIKHIYIADFDGSNEELLVADATISVAPRWNNNLYKPQIFYSEYTDTNVQLMSIDMQKNKVIASQLDGVTMLANFSPDGEKSVFCASKGKGSCQIYYQTKDALRPLTHNNGNNDSPVFIDNDHVCFCSDAQTKSPQIYIGNIQTGHIRRITKNGYCTSPSYCPKNNTIAYLKKVHNTMQIFTYDCATKNHTQITYSNENKYSVSWSPNGTHLMCAKEHLGKSHIISMNLTTKKVHQLTGTDANYSYPHWSPCYKHFPSVNHKTNRQILSLC